MSVSVLASLILPLSVAVGPSGTARATAGASKPPAGKPCVMPAPLTAAGRASTVGITPTSVTVGNVSILSGPIPGLFAGAPVGVKAYFDYVNAHGGVYGRKLSVTSDDDGFSGEQNQQETTQAAASDFAMVGSFSLFDNYGCKALAATPAMPDVSVSLDPSTNALANVFSTDPTETGWELGPFIYFKKHYPKAITSVGGLAGNAAAAIQHWVGIKAAMQHEGYHIVYQQYTTPLASDFTTEIVKMRQAGVQLVDITAEPVSDDGIIIRDMNQQNWHPMLVISGGPIYDSQFVSDAGGPAAVNEAATDGVWLDSTQSLYLGQDAKYIPAVKTFDRWVQKSDPGFRTDLYTLFGWTSAQLFTQALRAAGPKPTRGKVLAALSTVDTFNASGLLAPANPAGKVPPHCYILAKVVNGQFVRTADPPHGRFRCDGSYFYAAGGS